MAAKTQQRKVICEHGIISYMLTRKPVKNVNLRIKPDGSVLVSAGSRVPISFIDGFITQKQDFILNALSKYEKRRIERQNEEQDNIREYIDGERYTLLGENFILKVEEKNEEKIYIDSGYIYMNVKDKDNFRRKEILMTKWIKEYRTAVFNELIAEVYERFRQYNVPYPVLKIRTMKSRWGSCQPQKGIITLNSRLLSVSKNSIEYVVVHEFAHFIHPNHSKKFWDFVTMMMPDWMERRKELEK